MKNNFYKKTTFIGVNKAEKPDRKPYYPYGFRNLYKAINQLSLFMNIIL